MDEIRNWGEIELWEQDVIRDIKLPVSSQRYCREQVVEVEEFELSTICAVHLQANLFNILKKKKKKKEEEEKFLKLEDL